MADQDPTPDPSQEHDPVADAFAEVQAEQQAAQDAQEETPPPPEENAGVADEAAGEEDQSAAGVSADDAAAMAEALLAEVGAAVNDVNQGIMGGGSTDSATSGGSAEDMAGGMDASSEPAPIPEGAVPMDLPAFDGPTEKPVPAELDLLADVNLNVKIELGRTTMLVEDVLELTDGAVVELDKLAGDPVDIYVNERRIARGEVLVLNDTFCVRINEIIEPEENKAG